MTSLKTSIKTITYLSDIGCLEIQGASLINKILQSFTHLMVEAKKSIFHSKSMKVQGLQLVDELYIRARTGKMSY